MSVTYSITISDAWDEGLTEMAPTGAEKLALVKSLILEAYKSFKIKELEDASRTSTENAEKILRENVLALEEQLNNLG